MINKTKKIPRSSAGYYGMLAACVAGIVILTLVL